MEKGIKKEKRGCLLRILLLPLLLISLPLRPSLTLATNFLLSQLSREHPDQLALRTLLEKEEPLSSIISSEL